MAATVANSDIKCTISSNQTSKQQQVYPQPLLQLTRLKCDNFKAEVFTWTLITTSLEVSENIECTL